MFPLISKPSKRFLWRIYFWYVFVILSSLVGISTFATSLMSSEFLTQARNSLTDIAGALNETVKATMERDDDLQSAVKALSIRINTRITVIDPSGKVLADSDQEPSKMDNHLSRPEVKEALEGLTAHATRHSDTLDKDMLYVAYPAYQSGKIQYIVRVSKPLTRVFDLLSPNIHRLIFVGVLIGVIAATLSYLAYRRQLYPLEELKKAARQYASGEFGLRLTTEESQDMKELFEAMNQMAVQLDSRIKTVVQQSLEQEAVFESMYEGVMAISSDGKVVKANSALIKLLDGSDEHFKGRSVVEAVRNSDLQRFIREALHGSNNLEEEFTLHGLRDRSIRATARPLIDENGSQTGIVVVVHDLTKIKSLENMRRDFVANVSHELRTPITSIKGSVDTLIEGAVSDPVVAKKFLDIISRHSERLIKIVDDLLGLAKIEAGNASGSIEFEPLEISSIVHSAVGLCEQKASEKQVLLKTDGLDASARIFGNEILLEQALVNLITNAIEYSDTGSNVSVSFQKHADRAVVNVKDFGCGIPEPHLERIFERFYRVDRARTRKKGGTGLGLSIVKHIAHLHNGEITVQSALGRGSTFSLSLPASV